MADSFNLNDNSITAENKAPRKGLMQRALYALDENKTNTPQEGYILAPHLMGDMKKRGTIIY